MDALPHVDGVEHRFVDAGGLRVHVAEAGAGEPVVLLHGWPQHWYLWRGVIPRLAERYHVICPDLRGFGWTEAPGHGYAPAVFARDTVALIDALGIERARLVGHDWGGYTAFLLALDHPERVERMVVLCAPHPWPRIDLRAAAEVWRLWYVIGVAVGGRIVLPRAGGAIRRRLRAETYAERLRHPERARASRDLYRSYLRTTLTVATGRYRRRRLTVPTLLLGAARDAYVAPTVLRGFERHGDDLRLELVPGAGHFLPEEQPELTAARTLAFLSLG